MERESLVLIRCNRTIFNNGMGLFGEGVIVGIADSGIDYTNSVLEIRTEVREF